MPKRKLDPAPWCPRCGVMLSGVSVKRGPVPKPVAGDYTVCIYCTAPLEFCEGPGGLTLVELTGDKLREIWTDPDCVLIRGVILHGPVPPPPNTPRRH